jgi:hypothetical protein
MSLKDSEQVAIISTEKCFDKNAHIYLFGSRVDDTKKVEI